MERAEVIRWLKAIVPVQREMDKPYIRAAADILEADAPIETAAAKRRWLEEYRPLIAEDAAAEERARIREALLRELSPKAQPAYGLGLAIAWGEVAHIIEHVCGEAPRGK